MEEACGTAFGAVMEDSRVKDRQHREMNVHVKRQDNKVSEVREVAGVVVVVGQSFEIVEAEGLRVVVVG